MKIINRTVWILSLVSFFADVASEMLYPVIPVYLKEIGFSIFLIGVLEGIAEATAGLTKGYFGKRSDEQGKRLPFIKGGYFLSAISKPMMAIFTWPLWIFFARTIDRFGKGLRTAARDALLSRQATSDTKGRVFAFHRGMDTLGAVLGPMVALLFLNYFPGAYETLFYLAFLPGLLAVALIFLLAEKKEPVRSIKRKGFFSFLSYWKLASEGYKKLVPALLFLAFFNSSDVFLLLRTKEITGSDTLTIGAYIFYNLIYAASSYPAGMLADRFGLKTSFCVGLVLFATVYFLFAFTTSTSFIFLAFFIYGLFGASTEGIAKAWITNLSHEGHTATAIGFYSSFQSLCTLSASILAGFIWMNFGSSASFMLTAAAGIVTLLYLILFAGHQNTSAALAR